MGNVVQAAVQLQFFKHIRPQQVQIFSFSQCENEDQEEKA